MSMSPSLTSATLLGRLRCNPLDQEAWQEFVLRYGPKIYRWCRQWNLQEADAQDVAQNVLLKLAGKMSTFEYDPSRSFRGWLKLLTQHALSDFIDERRKTGVRAMKQLEEVAARDSLVKHLEEEFDRELFEEGLDRVQHRVAPQKWEAFRLTAIEGLSGAAAAAQLHMKVATVFTAKSKVHKLLQQEIERLENSGRE
jgi:RNA polymerase sigma-70 factor (ECF subfamily)